MCVCVCYCASIHIYYNIVTTIEFVVQHKEAEENHKKFAVEQLAGNAGVADYHFKRARMLYVAAAQEMSNELAGHYVKFDQYGIAVGLLLTSVVS